MPAESNVAILREGSGIPVWWIWSFQRSADRCRQLSASPALHRFFSQCYRFRQRPHL